jgi:hypothetical protein
MKRDILREANYRYLFDRDMYFNRQQKKAFSLEFVEDHPEEELVQHIAEVTGGNEWKFYSNTLLSDSLKRELEKVLA